jgi:hypothetical protein
MAQASGVRQTEAESLRDLATIFNLQGDFGRAIGFNEQALQIYTEIGYRMDEARVLNNLAMKGADDPFQIYLTCYRVLQANRDGRARQMLTTAHDLLQEQAGKLMDEDMRRSFLENVSTHRAIAEEFSKTIQPQ